MEIKDFKVGQTVFVELTGNAKIGKSVDQLIEEWTVSKVGKKYVHAGRKGSGFPIRFEKNNCGNANVFVQKTEYVVDYLLYASKADIEEKMEYEELSSTITGIFRHGSNKRLSLEQLRKIKEIIESEE